MIADLNYCRQIKKHLEHVVALPHTDENVDYMAACHYQLLQVGLAQKFSLPFGGVICNDPDLRAIRDSDELSLPFKMVALEYQRGQVCETKRLQGNVSSTRSVIFAAMHNEFILMSPCCWIDPAECWTPMPPVFIPRSGAVSYEGGKFGVRMSNCAEFKSPIPMEDYVDEAWTLMGFLNALACSNVSTVRNHPPTRHSKRNKRKKLGFDSYWVLEIKTHNSSSLPRQGGTHASPREHLRRGHVRHLRSGKNVWVNSAIIAAGSRGKIHKDYRMVEGHA